jgi:prepilin-type N-terminal cleavage/methylation domain-containing protein
MKTLISKSQRGFSLLELMVASAVGLIAVMAMTQLFQMGMNATLTVTQRAETQENMRAAIELMTKDIGMAGAGLPSGGLQLANSGGATKVACNQTGTCYVPADNYPLSGGGAQNYMYGILPGFGNGVQSAAVITAAPAAVNDSITSIYCDYNFPLTNFNFTFPSGTQATVAVINGGVTPNNILAPGGLNVGDLLLFTVGTPGNGKTPQWPKSPAFPMARPSTSWPATLSISIRWVPTVLPPSPPALSPAPPSTYAGSMPSLISCKFPPLVERCRLHV